MSSTWAGLVFVATLIAALALVHKPLGDYLARVLMGKRHLAAERVVYKAGGVDADADQTWGRYLRSVLAFSGVSVAFLYGFLRVQQHFWPPYKVPQMSPDQSWNTAASFITNTNWQSYSGENALGYVVQMAGLAVQNFLSAAVGIAVAIALVRGLARSKTDRLGNFWVDLTRISLRILLPVSIVFAIVFVGAGMVQNFHHYADLHTLAGGTRTMTGGPVASQEIIKEFGTNGGGFYNVNSAHPFENPTVWTNWLQIFQLAAENVVLRDRHGDGGARGTQLRPELCVPDGAPRHRSDGRRCEHGGHREAVRGAELGGVRDRDDPDLDRGGGQLPRQLHQPGRRHPAAQHDAR
jgi:K+-transporting ATPase ATPase A chain